MVDTRLVVPYAKWMARQRGIPNLVNPVGLTLILLTYLLDATGKRLWCHYRRLVLGLILNAL